MLSMNGPLFTHTPPTQPHELIYLSKLNSPTRVYEDHDRKTATHPQVGDNRRGVPVAGKTRRGSEDLRSTSKGYRGYSKLRTRTAPRVVICS